MYQSVIRDPGGNELVRIVPNVCDNRRAITDGSLLLVPPGTVAFVEINGMLSDPYGPGQYTLFTGQSPFFVRLRNIMTHGDTGLTVSVFYISTQKDFFFRLGTGYIPFTERRFRCTLNALGACNLTLSVSDPRAFLEKMIGSYATTFCEADLEPRLEQMLIAPVREILSRELSVLDIIQFNQKLTAISDKAYAPLSGLLGRYGLRLIRFSVNTINVPPEEMERLREHEKEYASGRIQIDLEKGQLDEIWGGDVNKRTLAEMLTGISNRAGHSSGGNPQRGGGGTDMYQLMAMMQMMPMLQQQTNSMLQHTDLFGGQQAPPNQNTSTANSPPPLPSRMMTCMHCNSQISRNSTVCPVCGLPVR